MIGIIGALDEEVNEISGNLEEKKTLAKAGYHYYSGRLNGRKATLVKCGVGKVNAAICTQILIDTFGCKKIIFGGVAGSLLPGLIQGDVVISSHVVQFDIE
jgi:adenosylhomocysteine nucleosidase